MSSEKMEMETKAKMEMKMETKSEPGSNGKLCLFCESNASKYNCPRCGLSYCSSDCYRSPGHSLCSQTFYREWVLNYLAETPPADETQAKTMDMIRRMGAQELGAEGEDFEDDEDEEEQDFEQRFAGLDLESVDQMDHKTYNQIMGRLTREERQEFEDLVKSGVIMDLIPANEMWNPWWFRVKPQLIEEVPAKEAIGGQGEEGAENEKESEAGPRRSSSKFDIPSAAAGDIPTVASLTSKPPSPALKHSMVNIIFSYCYVCRYYNGDYHLTPLEATQELLEVSPALEAGDQFEDTRQSLQTSVQMLLTSKSAPIPFVVQLLEDTKHILEKKELILRVFTDLSSLLKSAAKEAKESSRDMRSKLTLLSKKADFYVSWINEMGENLMETKLEIEMEIMNMKSHEKISQDRASVSRKGTETETEMEKVLIQEL